jgi:hypothetical protein
VEGNVSVDNGAVTTWSWSGTTYEWGTLDDTQISECTSIEGSVDIEGDVSTLTAFDGIELIAGTLHLWGDVEGFEDLDAFPALERIGGINIDGPRILLRISGFPKLREIAGALQLPGTLPEVTGLSRVERIGYLDIFGSDIRDFSWVRNLREVRRMYLSGTRIDDLAVFASLEVVHADLTISGTEVRDLGMPALRTVGRDFTVGGFLQVEEWNGFERLVSIGGNVAIAKNRNLSDGEIWEWLEGVDIGGGYVYVCENGPEETTTECPPF